MNLQELIEQKFTSGNSIPVERITVTRAEYESLAPAPEPLTEQEIERYVAAAVALRGMIATCGADDDQKATMADIAARSTFDLLIAVTPEGVDIGAVTRRVLDSLESYVSRPTTH